MNKKLLITMLVALLGVAVAGPSGARTAAAGSGPPNIDLGLNQAVMDAAPAPADDPLLDANGAVVVDATGHPVSDPNEGFHKVTPRVYDPDQTHLVQSTWLDGIGCPTNATIRQFNTVYPFNLLPPSKYTDPACLTGDSKDSHNEGLLTVKTGPTNDTPAAVADLKKVSGTTVHELGYDIRKPGLGTSAGPQGSHCGAGAPRFDVYTTDGLFFVGCSSPPPDTETPGDGFIRLRWGVSGVVMGYQNNVLVPITGTVQRISIIFDEGQDSSGGPDQFGAAILDNIDYNTQIVGRGPMGQGMQEDQSKDDDDD